jgi:hypothetical protein
LIAIAGCSSCTKFWRGAVYTFTGCSAVTRKVWYHQLLAVLIYSGHLVDEMNNWSALGRTRLYAVVGLLLAVVLC